MNDQGHAATASALLGPSGNQTSQTYRAQDSSGACYSRTLTAAAKQLTAVSDGGGCEGRD